MTDKIEEIPYIDDLTCTEVYAETVQSLFGSPGMLRFEFCVNRWGQTPPVKVRALVPVARLALSVESARIFRDQISRLLELHDQNSTREQFPAASTTKQ